MDERGNYLEICDVNGNFLNILLFEIRDYKKHYPLLSYINPWGNTYYNELQVKDLIIELEILKSEKFMKKYLSDIDKLILFAKNVTTHRYLKFIGD